MQSAHHSPPPQSQPGLGAPVPAPVAVPVAAPVAAPVAGPGSASASAATATSAPGPWLPPPPPSLTPQSEFFVRPTLPDRNVTAANIEDAYVRFILYCNPAISLATDTASLREAFNNPPRSSGKCFNTFTIYELVCKFYKREIRTWSDLATELGVPPPDPFKDESAQRVVQYGVRLKKWMNSMRIRAFFEYLRDVPNDYWTQIPTDPNPLSQPIRGGIALEDDMALRALFPHIRPKRGRKRPRDNDSATSPAQRPYLAPSGAYDDFRQGGGEALQVPVDPRACNTPWTPNDTVQQTPLTRWPQSAITPNTRGSFWDDALEPRSAITPSRSRLSSQRKGLKGVSSAWRPGFVSSGARFRGRPPMPRNLADGPFPPLPPLQQYMPRPSSNPHPQATPYEGPRPARPSISLQVPERPSGSVRLASPQPAVVVNDTDNAGRPAPMPSQLDQINGRTSIADATIRDMAPGDQDAFSRPGDIPMFYFERTEDRTNIDAITGYLTRSILEADWRDLHGEPAHAPSMDEIIALVHTTIETMYKTAESPQAFLINLAAISGGGMLLSSTMRVFRLGIAGETARYRCDWEYGFGSFRGQYTMEQQVPLAMFPDLSEKTGEESQVTADGKHVALSPREWQAKYHQLLVNIQIKDRELTDLRARVVDSLRSGSPTE